MMTAASCNVRPLAAVGFRDECCEKARFRQGCDEIGRIGALAVELAPIFAGKLRTQAPDRRADLRVVGADFGVVFRHLANHSGPSGRRYISSVTLYARSQFRAAIVDGHYVALQHFGTETYRLPIAPHLGPDGLTRKYRCGKPSRNRGQSRRIIGALAS